MYDPLISLATILDRLSGLIGKVIGLVLVLRHKVKYRSSIYISNF